MKFANATHKVTRTLMIVSVLLLAGLVMPCFGTDMTDLLDDSGLRYSQHCSKVARQPPAHNWPPSPEVLDEMACAYFTRGAMEGLVVADVHSRLAGVPLFDAPEDLSNTQVMLITLRYIDQHPEKMNQMTVTLMLNALRDTYPPKPILPPGTR